MCAPRMFFSIKATWLLKESFAYDWRFNTIPFGFDAESGVGAFPLAEFRAEASWFFFDGIFLIKKEEKGKKKKIFFFLLLLQKGIQKTHAHTFFL